MGFLANLANTFCELTLDELMQQSPFGLSEEDFNLMKGGAKDE
ncbi:hypothetical protein [uncultured Helicobacter sp.]